MTVTMDLVPIIAVSFNIWRLIEIPCKGNAKRSGEIARKSHRIHRWNMRICAERSGVVRLRDTGSGDNFDIAMDWRMPFQDQAAEIGWLTGGQNQHAHQNAVSGFT